MKQIHKYKIVLTFLVFVFSVELVSAQTNALKLLSTQVDFGRIAAIAYPPKRIEFVNAGTEKLAILLVEKGPYVKVRFEHRFYQPGEKGIIYVNYEVGTLGDFTEEIKIYTNTDEMPQTVTLKGTCISVQECFPNINNLTIRNIMVVNKITQEPVPLAEVSFVRNHNTSNQVTLKMDKAGKTTNELPIGLYDINASVKGFAAYDTETFIPKTMPLVVIELTPLQRVQPPAPVTQVTQAPQSIQERNPEITSVDLPENKYAANNIVLLLDVSSSMHSQGKFSLLQQSINNLVLILRPIDYVTIITYASDAKVVMPAVPGNEKDKITGIVQDLSPHGSTQGVKGLNMAYDMATQQFIKGGNNQIILATDGEFSEKGLTDEYYQNFISGYAQKGIKLSILGFGINQSAIGRMKKMADSGNGSFILIDSEKFVKNALIDEIKTMSFIKE